MVRRDDDRNPDPVRVRNLPSRCEDPAGESPASGSAGAPRSRPAAEGETPTAEAGRRKRARQRKLFSTKQARGPQHQVKPAASTDEQSESRAGYFAAKATSLARAPERGEDLGGVWGAARVQGSSRNTRGPSAQPSSRLGGSNRPGAKAAIAQRKSDGVIVPTMAATNNAAGGKGHERGHVGEEGKRKGMTGRAACCERASTGRARPCAGTFRRLMESSDPWGSRRSGTGWCRWRPSSCWSRSSRRISFRARTAIGLGGAS